MKPVTTALKRSLSTFWTSPEPEGEQSLRATATVLAWVAAVGLILQRLVLIALPGTSTDDFTTVWSAARRFVERVPVYNENYAHVDPHYLYNPGATLLLSPLGLFSDVATVRPLFIMANAFAIICAIAWLTHFFGYGPKHPVFPAAIALAFLTESVTNTLNFGNINGILLLAVTAFLILFLSGKSLPAGLILGLAVLVKPMLAPLLVLPLMRLDFKALGTGIAVPVVFNLVAWPLTPGARDYIDVVTPYLGITRDYANSSIAGFAVYFGMPGWLQVLLVAVVGAAVAIALLGLASYRYSSPVTWAFMSTGVLVAGVSLLSSLGQAYYSIMLIPAAFTVLHRFSPMRNPIPWIGLFLCMSPPGWQNAYASLNMLWWLTHLPTLGWAVFIIATATWVVSEWLREPPQNPDLRSGSDDELPGTDRSAMAREAHGSRIRSASPGRHRAAGSW